MFTIFLGERKFEGELITTYLQEIQGEMQQGLVALPLLVVVGPLEELDHARDGYPVLPSRGHLHEGPVKNHSAQIDVADRLRVPQVGPPSA